MTAARKTLRPRSAVPSSFALNAVKRATLKDQSYLELRRGLLSGQFEPGEQLTVRELSERLSSGIMPIREAVQRLVAEGALASSPTGRIYVPQLTRTAFEQIIELRLLLEPLSAEKAASIGGAELDDALQDWEKELEVAVAQGKHEAVLWANYQFHFAIYTHANADLLSQHIESLWLRAGPLIVHLFRTPEQQAEFLAVGAGLHRDLCKALRKRSGPAAREGMRKIIQTAASWHRESYRFSNS